MNASQKSSFWPIVAAVGIAFAVIIAISNEYKTFLPEFLKPSMHLGLDLAGGTQLDFRISEDEIKTRKQQLQEEIEALKADGANTEVTKKERELQSLNEQHTNIVEAIRTVLERRINSLGVSEATITPSYYGDEKHLLVECPGIIDIDRCIATVGKTIQLEFKEEFTGEQTDYAERIRTQAESVYRSIAEGTGSLLVHGQDLSSQLGVSYFDERALFVSALPRGLEELANRTPEDPVLKSEAVIQTVSTDPDGQQIVREIRGIYLTKVLSPKVPVERPLTDPQAAYPFVAQSLSGAVHESKSGVALESTPEEYRTTLQTMPIGSQEVVVIGLRDTALLYLLGRTDGGQEMTASHILVQYEGAERADPSVTRTKEKAKELIDDIRRRLTDGADFNTIARTESDGPSKEQAGSLGVIRPGMMVQPFESAAFALEKGGMSGVVETPFGYHIIRADEALATQGAVVSYEIVRTTMDETAARELMGKIEAGEITRMEEQIVIRGIFFSLEPTGWKDTELNGQRFRSATVTVDPVTNVPVVQIQFDEEGGKLFQELTKRNIGKSIAIFVGGELVSAPTVQGEISGGSAVITGSSTFEEAQTLARDLNTGAIPAPIYLSGQSTVEATLGATALEQSVFAAAVGFAVLCLFMIIVYRLFGVIASIALIIYTALIIAGMKLPVFLVTDQYVVLTLAGIAGIILSMGMAVDANVLAFERIKEELKKGKTYKTAVDTGFKKAWPSIRDGNISTLITSAILFTIGTSIIRGFAATLTIGIFISIFTSYVVSRWLCRLLVGSPLSERMDLFGVKKSESPLPDTY